MAELPSSVRISAATRELIAAGSKQCGQNCVELVGWGTCNLQPLEVYDFGLQVPFNSLGLPPLGGWERGWLIIPKTDGWTSKKRLVLVICVAEVQAIDPAPYWILPWFLSHLAGNGSMWMCIFAYIDWVSMICLLYNSTLTISMSYLAIPIIQFWSTQLLLLFWGNRFTQHASETHSGEARAFAGPGRFCRV